MKNETGGSYIELHREISSHKNVSDRRSVILTGDANEKSIGAAIRDLLRQHSKFLVNSYLGDVRSPFPGNFYGHDVLIMSHGIARMNWIGEMSDDDVNDPVYSNLCGSISMVNQFVKETIDSPVRKTIISIGSMAHQAILNGSSSYCASKAGLAHFMRCAAWELAPKGYDVFSVHPSNTLDTPMTDFTIESLARYRNLSIEEARQYWSDGLLRKAHLTKGEIANLVLFLLGPDVGYISGSDLNLGGGAR